MKTDGPIKIFFYEAHPLMVLGVDALIKKEKDLELCGYSSDHHVLIEELARAEPDSLILDLSLYTAESLKFIEKIHRRFPDLRIVLLSVHTARDYVAKAQKAGASGYVLKTEDPHCILQAVRTAMAGETYISERVSSQGPKKAGPIDSPINLLTTQEFQILQRIGKGETNRQISEDLQLPVEAVEHDVSAIQEKLGLSSFVELLPFAFHWVHHEGGFS
jgi:DNA-binding NarL/FixJ family response regulator